MVLGDGFILLHLFRHGRVKVHLTLLSGFTKTWCWPTIEAAKGWDLVLVGGCLGRVGRVFGGCWVVWWRDVLEPVRGLRRGLKCAGWVEKA